MHTGWRQGAQTLAKSVWNSPSVPVWRTSPPFALLTLMILIPHANTIHLLQLNNSGFSLTLRLWEQKYGGRPGNYKFLPYFVCPNLSELHCLLWNWGEEVKHCRRMVHWLKKFLSPNNTFKKTHGNVIHVRHIYTWFINYWVSYRWQSVMLTECVYVCVCVHTQLQPNRGDNLSLPMVPRVFLCGMVWDNPEPYSSQGQMEQRQSLDIWAPMPLVQCAQAQHIHHCKDVATKSTWWNPDSTVLVWMLSCSMPHWMHYLYYCHHEHSVQLSYTHYSTNTYTARRNKLNKSYCCKLNVWPIISEMSI